MEGQKRWLFWIETCLGSISALLFAATIVWPDWLELIFHIDPDNGNGTVEWLIVAITALIAIMCFALARMEWRRAHAAARS